MNDTIQYRSAKKWQIVCWGAGSVIGNIFLLLMMYVSYIANAGYGIAVGVIGVILTFTRIFDGVIDPLVALISDRINTKFGKVRILMWLGWGIMSLACFIMFSVGANMGLSGIVGMLFFIVTYLIYIVGYTFVYIGSQIGSAILTNNPKQRPMLGFWQSIFGTVLMMAFGMVINAVILPIYGEYNVAMLSTVSFAVMATTAVMLTCSSFAITKRDVPETFVTAIKREKPIGLKDCAKMLKNNRALQMLIVAAASDKLALQTAGNTAFNTILFGILIGNMTMGSMMSVFLMPISILFTLFGVRMATKVGNKAALVRWTWLAIIASAIATVVYLVVDLPAVFTAAVPTVIFLVAYALKNGAQSATSAVTAPMLADVADYEMSRSSNFMPGTVAATYSFVDKLISSLATTIAGFSLATIGYVSVMPQPNDPATSGALILCLVMTMGVPVIGWVCTLFAMKWYPLTKEKMEEVQARNNELRAEGALTDETTPVEA